MLILLNKDAPEESLQAIYTRLTNLGLDYRSYDEPEKRVIVTLDTREMVSLDALEALPGVERVVNVTTPYKLVSREYQERDTVVKVGQVEFGGNSFQVIAGPCAVENENQLLSVARLVKQAGAVMLRGGAYKPRTSPYSFQGLELEGLKLLAKARELTGLPVVTEIMDIRDTELVAAYADMLQIGARNMQNYPLLREAARTAKPIMLKRGLSATLEEWLLAAEYILQEGNNQVVLCERGIRTFEKYTRNTLDLAGAAALQLLSHLPVIVDPSHGTGRVMLVASVTRAAYALGVHGVMIEVHPEPSEALSDGEQSLTPEKFQRLMAQLNLMKVGFAVRGRDMLK